MRWHWLLFLLWATVPLGCDTTTGQGGRDGSTHPDGPATTCASDEDCSGNPMLRLCRAERCVDPGCPAGMTYVGVGAYTRGCNKSDKGCGDDSQPAHQVTLSHGFCISRTELTVAQFRACVSAGRCKAPADLSCTTRASWTAQPGSQEGLPLSCLYHSEARAACEFGGGRLPTEAEWEKAARGSDGRKYPWGDTAVMSCGTGVNWAGLGGCPGGPWPAGSGQGKDAQSASFALDMAGNLWEWTADWYSDKAYAGCTMGCTDPQGPQSGILRVRRGGSYASENPDELRASYREFHTPEMARSDLVGVRCAAAPR